MGQNYYSDYAYAEGTTRPAPTDLVVYQANRADYIVDQWVDIPIIILSWNYNISPQSFSVERKDGVDGEWKEVIDKTSGSTGATDKGPFVAETMYYYRVRAYRNTPTGKLYSPYSEYTDDWSSIIVGGNSVEFLQPALNETVTITTDNINSMKAGDTISLVNSSSYPPVLIGRDYIIQAINGLTMDLKYVGPIGPQAGTPIPAWTNFFKVFNKSADYGVCFKPNPFTSTETSMKNTLAWTLNPATVGSTHGYIPITYNYEFQRFNCTKSNTTAIFTQPAMLSSVDVDVDDVSWMSPSMSIYIGTGEYWINSISTLTINVTLTSGGLAEGTHIAIGAEVISGDVIYNDWQPNTFTTAEFFQPAVDANVTVQVQKTAWMTNGDMISINNYQSPIYNALYQVANIINDTSVSLTYKSGGTVAWSTTTTVDFVQPDILYSSVHITAADTSSMIEGNQIVIDGILYYLGYVDSPTTFYAQLTYWPNLTTSSFLVPAQGEPVAIQITSTVGMIASDVIKIYGALFTIVSHDSDTQLTVSPNDNIRQGEYIPDTQPVMPYNKTISSGAVITNSIYDMYVMSDSFIGPQLTANTLVDTNIAAGQKYLYRMRTTRYSPNFSSSEYGISDYAYTGPQPVQIVGGYPTSGGYTYIVTGDGPITVTPDGGVPLPFVVPPGSGPTREIQMPPNKPGTAQDTNVITLPPGPAIPPGPHVITPPEQLPGGPIPPTGPGDWWPPVPPPLDPITGLVIPPTDPLPIVTPYNTPKITDMTANNNYTGHDYWSQVDLAWVYVSNEAHSPNKTYDIDTFIIERSLRTSPGVWLAWSVLATVDYTHLSYKDTTVTYGSNGNAYRYRVKGTKTFGIIPNQETIEIESAWAYTFVDLPPWIKNPDSWYIIPSTGPEFVSQSCLDVTTTLVPSAGQISFDLTWVEMGGDGTTGVYMGVRRYDQHLLTGHLGGVDEDAMVGRWLACPLCIKNAGGQSASITLDTRYYLNSKEVPGETQSNDPLPDGCEYTFFISKYVQYANPGGWIFYDSGRQSNLVKCQVPLFAPVNLTHTSTPINDVQRRIDFSWTCRNYAIKYDNSPPPVRYYWTVDTGEIQSGYVEGTNIRGATRSASVIVPIGGGGLITVYAQLMDVSFANSISYYGDRKFYNLIDPATGLFQLNNSPTYHGSSDAPTGIYGEPIRVLGNADNNGIPVRSANIQIYI